MCNSEKALVLVFVTASILFGAVTMIPTDVSQESPKLAYAFAWEKMTNDQWALTGDIDPELANPFGELPLLWIASGTYRGQFVYPDTLDTGEFDFDYAWLSSFDIDDVPKSYSLVVPGGDCIAIYRSEVNSYTGQTITWESAYFPMAFQALASGSGDDWFNVYPDSGTTGFAWNTQLVIIPAFESSGGDGGDYIREAASRFPEFGDALISVLNNGGTIYAEGNGGYLLEALGIIPLGTVDLSDYIDGIPADFMLAAMNIVDETHPLSFVSASTGIYTVSAPTLSDDYRTILRYASAWNPDDIGKPAAIEISGAAAHGGKILLVGGMPTAAIPLEIDDNQWQWTANAVYSAFAQKLLYVRSVHSPVVLPESTHVAPYAIPADDSVTIEITVKLRNLWDEPLSNIVFDEYKRGYFYYIDCPTGPIPAEDGNTLTWELASISANTAQDIVYRLRTPDSDDPLVWTIGDYLSGDELRPSTGVIIYEDAGGVKSFEYRYDIWTKVLFNAVIIADADLNWKNILGEYFQPFKIFMTMENKERTSALETKYVQMIPIDVPIYWVAEEAIPIIRTPGGQFVDVLSGIIDADTAGPIAVEYDMDGDDSPDAWLDFSTIHPEPTTVELDSVYWFNPWTDEYEDIDHDGARAQDTDGDGFIDIDEPGDKIRVWKVTWDIDEVPGYQWYDPYASWELWIDPPPLLDMAKGAAFHLGLDMGERDPADTGFFYENWLWWMERDSITDEPVLVRLIGMNWGSYEGFRFEPDTGSIPIPDDPVETDLGIIPYPRREYIALLNLGGHEPTMTTVFPPPEDTLYSKITYYTIWDKYKTTPIRVSYTYYTPLPNPLQFEYVNQVFTITDPSSSEELPFLPSNGDAYIDFKVTASTEYSKYWLANVGKDFGQFDFDYTDFTGRAWDRTSPMPDGLGDGVFGYVMVTIPKGIGAYSMEIDWDNLFLEFEALIDTNPLIPTEVFAVEYPFKWELYCPQIMIPPGFDDDNFDHVDDWDDDLGDRFVSPTGYLNDIFPPIDGDTVHAWFGSVLPWWDTTVVIEGDLVTAHSGWYPGEDNSYGDDLCEKLGETHLNLRVIWHGTGHEGLVKINEGATLVNEEIFGGSPWVQWSHTLHAEAKGHHIAIVDRDAYPTVVSLYPDTVYLRYQLMDWGEPHYFDIDFDPYITAQSNGYMNTVVRVGGKEPASLFNPDITMRSRIDPGLDYRYVENIGEFDDTLNPGYQTPVNDAITCVIVEVDNASGMTWDDVSCRLDLSALGSTTPVFWYGVYPRPFVPAHRDDDTGEWVPGDDPRTFSAGWRFNPSEREVLFQYGNTDGSVTIPEVQSSRRVYYIFHLVIDTGLPVDVYNIPVEVSGVYRSYEEPYGSGTPFTEYVESAKLAIVSWTSNDSPGFIIGQANLEQFSDVLENYVEPMVPVEARWSWSEPDPDYFDAGIYNILHGSYSDGVLTLDPDPQFETFPPEPTRNNVWMIARTVVDAEEGTDDLLISDEPSQSYIDLLGIEGTVTGRSYSISVRGPSVLPLKSITNVNGTEVDETGEYVLIQDDNDLTIELMATNAGNTIATMPKFIVQIGKDANFAGVDSDFVFSYNETDRIVEIDIPHIAPGLERTIPLYLNVPTTAIDSILHLCYAFTTEFYGVEEDMMFMRVLDDSVFGRKFTEIAPETLFYGANFILSDDDIVLSNETPDIGEQLTITATVRFEGNMKIENIPVRLLTEDLTAVGNDQIIAIFAPGTIDSIHNVQFQHTVADDYEKLFVVVDPDSQYGELKEIDNIAVVEIFTGKGDPVKDVVNYPNPFKNYTEFVYTLTRSVKSVEIEVYTLRGRMIKKFDCPTTPGYNSVGWNGMDTDGDPIANGSYIYKLTCEDKEGEKFEVKSIAVRMR